VLTPTPKPPVYARPSVHVPAPANKEEIVLEVSDADLVEQRDTDDLDFEWAPVPAVRGLGR
jgi:hypothetical protein